MLPFITAKKPIFRKIWKIARVLLISILVLFAVSIIYVTLNKKKFIAQVTAFVNEKIDGDVSIEDVNISFFKTFPWASVQLMNLKVRDSMYKIHRNDFLNAKETYVSLSPWRAILGKNPVRGIKMYDAIINLYTDSTGYSNKYLLKSKKKQNVDTTKRGFKELFLEKINLQNVHIILKDLQRNKYHDITGNKLKVKIKESDGGIVLFKIDSDLDVKSLSFNVARGIYLENKKFGGDFDLLLDKKKNMLSFDSINVNIAEHPFNLTGSFDLGDKNPQFILRFHTRKISYTNAQGILAKRIAKSLQMVQLDKPLDVDGEIQGPLRGGDPLIVVNATPVEKTSLLTPFFDFQNAMFAVTYTNEVQKGLPRKDPNSSIIIRDFGAEWKGLPVNAQHIDIVNLKEPQLSCDLNSDFDLIKLNELIGSSIHFNSGRGRILLSYKGPVVRNDNTNSFLNGFMEITGANLQYAPRNIPMIKIAGRILFANSNVTVEDLRGTVYDNTVILNGKADNLLTLVNKQPNAVIMNWDVYSPSLNLGRFTSMIKTRAKVPSQGKTGAAATAAKIDRLLDEGKVVVNINTPKITYKNFAATNLLANVSLVADNYTIHAVKMNHAGGSIDLQGSLTSKTNSNTAILNADVRNVDVGTLFKAFDNFGQDGITASNLDGKITTKVNATVAMDDEGKVLPKTTNGTVDFSLKNGTLINFAPLKRIQSFVFKNRDFENIKFAEIKNRLTIRNGEISIPRMEIQSSVLSLFVEGNVSMRGNTDVSVQVPLSNLKKRKADFIPENIGTDAKTGRSIYLRGKPGPDGNVKFGLDLFKKYFKEREGQKSNSN